MKLIFPPLATALFLNEVRHGSADAESDLAAARALWDSFDHDTYGYGFKRDCFCMRDFRAPLRTNVENNVLTSVTTWTGGNATEAVVNTVRTIDQLFEQIQSALEDGVCSTNIVYNDQWGYPEDISIDYDCRMADEEYYVHIENVTFYSELEIDLDEAQSLWESADIHTYNYLYSYRGTTAEVEVVNDAVIGVVAINPDAPVMARSANSYDNNQIPTIMDLFDLIQEAINLRAFRVEVEYNETLGYPSSIFIDYVDSVDEDELSISVAPVSPGFTAGTVNADATGVDIASMDEQAKFDSDAMGNASSAPALAEVLKVETTAVANETSETEPTFLENNNDSAANETSEPEPTGLENNNDSAAPSFNFAFSSFVVICLSIFVFA